MGHGIGVTMGRCHTDMTTDKYTEILIISIISVDK